MKTVHTIPELRAQIHSWQAEGRRIAFVPTMGNLHRGHVELMHKARELGDKVVVSIFVNPLQFGPQEDFEHYPRTLKEDQAALTTVGADLLFAPNAREIYPRGMDGLSKISVPGLSTILCGQYRPGHFDGVATVVNLLFNLVQPQVAVFGEKDYQQLLVIRRMAADLHLPVEIVGHPTLRESDGLAMSSRNQYLNAEERRKAAEIYATLSTIAGELRKGRRDYAALQDAGRRRLEGAGFKPQYLEIRTPDLAEPADTAQEFVVLVAAYMGATRLIDNLVVRA